VVFLKGFSNAPDCPFLIEPLYDALIDFGRPLLIVDTDYVQAFAV
jgi:hypothetical protein